MSQRPSPFRSSMARAVQTSPPLRVPVLRFRFDDPEGSYGLRYVNLGGRGIRDIARVKDGFLLLAGPEGQAWLEAAATLGDERVTARCLSAEELPELDGWLAAAGIERGGALLVRPDQHVAWRSRSAAGAGSLAKVLAELVGDPATPS